MPASMTPLSTASSIIGFVSFTITLLTLIRVSWSAIMTLWVAPQEVHFAFDNLRQEIYELREDLRKARHKRRHSNNNNNNANGEKLSGKGDVVHLSSSVSDGDKYKVLHDTLRHLQKEFRRLERPFLSREKGEDDLDTTDHWTHYTSRMDYCNMDLGHRFIWLRSKSQVLEVGNRISRIQLRRVAAETHDIIQTVHAIERSFRQLDDRMWSMEERAERKERNANRTDDGRIYIENATVIRR